MIKKIKSSDFIRSSFTLISGTASAQLITIALSPILTRLYTPEEFGLLALFVSITSILAVFACGQYQRAILLPKRHEYAFHITCLCLLITLISSVLILTIIVIYPDVLDIFTSGKDIGIVAYLIPLKVLGMGVFAALNGWFVRQRKFKTISLNHISQSVTNNGLSVGFALNSFTSLGLIFAQIISQLLIACRFSYLFITGKTYKVQPLKAIALARRYKKFPQITLPHAFFNSLAAQLPNILFVALFSPAIAGFYFFANKVANAPLKIMSQSMHQVFFVQFRESKNRKMLYKKRFLQINGLLLPLFVILWFVLPLLFKIIFGAEWYEAGVYTQILLPLLYFKFISNLFTTTAYIFYEKQFENLLFEIVITFCYISSLYIGAYFSSVIIALWLITISNTLIIFLKLIRSYIFTRCERGGHVKNM